MPHPSHSQVTSATSCSFTTRSLHFALLWLRVDDMSGFRCGCVEKQLDHHTK
eukprot:m.120040 g.120040  ORF g.120040 m.120040 type:complete len:52 (+) comp13683_c0_seq16:1593-1748(+)